MDDLSSDRMQTALTAVTVAGMCLAIIDAFAVPGAWGWVGLASVYLAGGVPAALRALFALWRERSLDIDLLMVIAAIAARRRGRRA